MKYIPKCNNIVLTELSDLEYMRNIIMEEFMSNNIVFYSNEYDHKLYPIISLAFGPPKINWKYCAHYNCGKKFNTSDNLIEHLKTYNIYIPHYTASHKICEEKNGLYYCKSHLCNFNTVYKDDMIMHFKLLGIKPYFSSKI